MSDTQQILHLKPEQIDLGDNIRFGLDPSRVRALADSIIDTNGVQEPVSVYAKPGNRYGLLKGFYRHAAVSLINSETGAGLPLPAQVKEQPDEVNRLKLQVTENVARAEMTPMDTANAMKQLLDAGVEKAEVRRLFPRVGGRKGASSQPANNSTINLYLSLLDLPKSMQTDIHLGLVSATAGFNLARIEDAGERTEVYKRAKELAAAAREKEDKEEEKFLKVEEREQTTRNMQAKLEEDLKAAKGSIEEYKKLDKTFRAMSKEKLAAFNAAKKQAPENGTDAEVKKWQEHVKSAEADKKAADKNVKDNSASLAAAIKRRDKLQAKLDGPEKTEASAKPEKKPKAEKKAPAVGPKDVAKAKKEVAPDTAPVPLKPAELRQALKDVAKDKDPFVAAVGALFLQLSEGKTTPKILASDLKKLAAK